MKQHNITRHAVSQFDAILEKLFNLWQDYSWLNNICLFVFSFRRKVNDRLLCSTICRSVARVIYRNDSIIIDF